MQRSLLFLLAIILLASCVPNRKYVYMQKDDVKKKDIPLDTTLRTYHVDEFDYKIQTQDILLVRFQSLTDEQFDFLSRSTSQGMGANPAFASLFGEMVDNDGNIAYPVIGKVSVRGLSIFEAQAKLQEIANTFLESPKVSVRLLNFRVTILGEVQREGQVSLTNNRVSMLEVMGLVGGLSEFADKSKVKLLRQEGGKMTVQYIDLLDENFVTSPYYYVHQNDILVVPPLQQRSFRRYFAPNLAIFMSVISSVTLLTFTIIQNQNQN